MIWTDQIALDILRNNLISYDESCEACQIFVCLNIHIPNSLNAWIVGTFEISSISKLFRYLEYIETFR